MLPCAFAKPLHGHFCWWWALGLHFMALEPCWKWQKVGRWVNSGHSFRCRGNCLKLQLWRHFFLFTSDFSSTSLMWDMISKCLMTFRFLAVWIYFSLCSVTTNFVVIKMGMCPSSCKSHQWFIGWLMGHKCFRFHTFSLLSLYFLTWWWQLYILGWYINFSWHLKDETLKITILRSFDVTTCLWWEFKSIFE